MLQKAIADLRDDAIVARDGRIGAVKDVYIDDERWAVRYLVVDTGEWLPGRKVLISPASVSREPAKNDAIRVELTREQVENAPAAEQAQPVSRLYEAAHARHYGHPYYWAGPYLWGPAPLPGAIPPAPGGREYMREREREMEQIEARARESHLRSSAELVGYRIAATDGEIGHVEDFLVDDQSWQVADMVVDTRNWLPGRKVRVPLSAIEHIDWNQREVRVRLSKEEVRRAPEAA